MNKDVIGAIYDGALADPPWATTLPMLRRATGARQLMLKFSPPDAADGTAIFTDSPSPQADWAPGGPCHLYTNIYQYKDPVSYAGMARGEVRQLEELIDRRSFLESSYYREHCLPLDIQHAFFAYLGRHDGTDVWLNGSRGGKHGAFTRREIAAAHALVPHLSRAVVVHRRLACAAARTAAYAHSISAAGIGMIMLDRRGGIVETNAEADLILAAGCPARIGARLHLTSAAQQSYAAALGQVAATGTPAVQTLLGEDGVTSVNLVIRRAVDVMGREAGSDIAFLLYLNRPPRPLPPRAAEFAAKTFGLTPAEARLSVLFANGHSIEEAASLLRVTPTTARTYCKRALAKTGAARQSELVRLLVSSLARMA